MAKKIPETTIEHYVWIAETGGHRIAFSSQDAANAAADMIESHTGNLTKVYRIRFHYGNADVKDLIRFIREASPNAL